MLLTPTHLAARAHVVTTGRPSLLARVGSTWRWPLAAAALVAAVAHVPVTAEHLREAPYIGVLFVLLEVAGVVLALALALRPTRAALLATAVVGGLAVLMLVISRTVGLPMMSDDIGDWTEPLAVVSLVSESLMVVGGVAGLLRPTSFVSARVGVAAGLLVLLVGGIATGLATAAEAAPDAGSAHHTTSDMHDIDMGLGAPIATGA